MWHLLSENYRNFKQSTSTFKGSKVLGQCDLIVNITIIFNTWLEIFCSQCLAEVRSPWRWPDSEFPPQRCFARASQQPPPFWTFLPSVPGKHALLDWDQITDLAIEDYSFSLPSKSRVAFAVCLVSPSICSVKHWPLSVVRCGWMWAECSSVHPRNHLATTVLFLLHVFSFNHSDTS